jgi:DNA-binding NarL/FixJ family response regulator
MIQGKEKLRVLLADHHPAVRSGIRVMLAGAKGGERFEVDEASAADEVLSLVRNGGYSVVLLAVDLPGGDRVRTTELILQRSPGMRVLGVMDRPEREIVERLVRAGAMGCILTTIEADTLVSALRTVLVGRQFYSNDIALCLLEPGVRSRLEEQQRLTDREREVLQAILNGMCHQEVAELLGISKRTVDKHREHLNAKLGVRNMVELVKAGVRLGLVGGGG